MEFLNHIIKYLQINFNSMISEIDLINLSISLGLFFIVLIFKNFIKLLLKKKIKFLTSLKNKKSKELSESFDSLITFFVYFIAFFIFSITLDTSQKISIFFEKINLSLFTILIFWMIQQTVEPIITGIKNIKLIFSSDLLEWIIKALKIIIFILGFSAVLELWGIKVGAIIAGLGLFGVAVALGAQDLFKNLISGILVLVEKRFKKGDVIIIENIIEGSVEKIGFRSTAIRKFDKSICYIPNFQFAENAVTNISETTYRRINWIIGLEYKSTVNQLKRICNDIENYVSKNSKDFKVTNSIPVIVKIDEFADSSINILVRCFANTKDYNEFLNIKDRFAIELKNIIDKRKGSFAFPSQSIYIEKNS
tara:strand:- start:1608 stop:2702 length:1095 start_codon:yes stop_codon:yes gene_type:complete